jgi:hypothetical protein
VHPFHDANEHRRVFESELQRDCNRHGRCFKGQPTAAGRSGTVEGLMDSNMRWRYVGRELCPGSGGIVRHCRCRCPAGRGQKRPYSATRRRRGTSDESHRGPLHRVAADCSTSKHDANAVGSSDDAGTLRAQRLTHLASRRESPRGRDPPAAPRRKRPVAAHVTVAPTQLSLRWHPVTQQRQH